MDAYAAAQFYTMQGVDQCLRTVLPDVFQRPSDLGFTLQTTVLNRPDSHYTLNLARNMKPAHETTEIRNHHQRPDVRRVPVTVARHRYARQRFW
jgi:hypothetical protein